MSQHASLSLIHWDDSAKVGVKLAEPEDQVLATPVKYCYYSPIKKMTSFSVVCWEFRSVTVTLSS